ncbi:MAG: hypothetical protein M5U08_21490 [Burkholderiales bacterium]|nr:hypothetical protein [Burkholderiales bacterium]
MDRDGDIVLADQRRNAFLASRDESKSAPVDRPRLAAVQGAEPASHCGAG